MGVNIQGYTIPKSIWNITAHSSIQCVPTFKSFKLNFPGDHFKLAVALPDGCLLMLQILSNWICRVMRSHRKTLSGPVKEESSSRWKNWKTAFQNCSWIQHLSKLLCHFDRLEKVKDAESLSPGVKDEVRIKLRFRVCSYNSYDWGQHHGNMSTGVH